MNSFINGFTLNTFMDRIREYNGFRYCGDDDMCYYRHPGNEHFCCLVGAFIPDEKYDKEMDSHPKHKYKGLSAEQLLDYFNHLNKNMPLNTSHLIRLQDLHDTSFDGASKKYAEKLIIHELIKLNVISEKDADKYLLKHNLIEE